MMNIDPEIKKMHRQMLWNTCRVRTTKAGGSGTIIYSKPNKKGDFETYILTCDHVIASACEVKEKFDSLVGMDRKREFRQPVSVEFFDYEQYSRCKGSKFATKATIVARNPDRDIALLKLHKTEEITPIAYLFPKDQEREIHVYDELHSCGAALGHEPITTVGQITFMDELVEGREYWMSNALGVFGDSGGSVYRYSKERDKYEFIGMPALLKISNWGFSGDPVHFMGFFVPIPRIYKFLDDNFYQFIYDENFTVEQCEELRTDQKEKMQRLVLAKFGAVEK